MLTVAFVMVLAPVFGQNDNANDTIPNGWRSSGQVALFVNQTAFNANWQDGGTSNYAGNLNLDYEMDYKKDRLSWDNGLRAEYGITKNKGEEFSRKTNDRLQINSTLGYQVEENSKWYYSFFADFRTQFAKGYDYEDVDITDPVTGNKLGTETVRTESSNFMSPGYLKFGPGMLYKDGDLLKINIAPATSRFIFADDRFTTITGYEDGDYYGLDAGKSMRFEFGASVDITSKFTLVKNVDIKNRLSLYSNYLEDPKNVDLDYTLNIDMKINEWLSANFVFQAIYDDNAVGAFQIREGLGVGLSYKLN